MTAHHTDWKSLVHAWPQLGTHLQAIGGLYLAWLLGYRRVCVAWDLVSVGIPKCPGFPSLTSTLT